jgi:hypothetical protein
MSEKQENPPTAEAANTPPRPPQECVDELQRELSVRERCYPRWVSEGRLSRTDARDRTERLQGAIRLLERALDIEAADPGHPY